MGTSARRRVQIAREATAFTRQAATYRLVGQTPDLKFTPGIEALGGFNGALVRTVGHYMTERSGEGSIGGPLLRDVEAVAAFYHGMHSAVRSGSAGAYTYAFRQVPDFGGDVPTMTMEYGDADSNYAGVGGVATGYTIAGAVGKAVDLSTDYAFSDVVPLGGGLTTIAAPAGGTNEQQTITITGSPAGGTFTLTYDGQSTEPLAYNAANAVVETALRDLPTINGANVNVTGTPGTSYVVTFVGALANRNVGMISATHAFTGGTVPGINVAETTPGAAGTGRDYSAIDRFSIPVLTNDMQLYVNNSLLSNSLTGFSIKINTGVNLSGKVDGTLQRNSRVYAAPTITGTFTLKTGADQRAQFANVEGVTPAMYELRNSANTFAMRFAAQVTDPSGLEDADADSSMTFSVMDVYQSSLSLDPLLIILRTPYASYT